MEVGRADHKAISRQNQFNGTLEKITVEVSFPVMKRYIFILWVGDLADAKYPLSLL